MNIKENDEIYAYEILKVSSEIEKEYKQMFCSKEKKPSIKTNKPENFAVNEFVDIKDKKGEWVYGKILDKKE
jgi:hypothetical protein